MSNEFQESYPDETEALLAERREKRKDDNRPVRLAGCVDVGEVMREVVPRMIENGKRIMEERKVFKKEIEPEYTKASAPHCPKHPKVKMAKDWESTVALSWRRGSFALVCKPCKDCLVNEKEQRWILRGIPIKVVHATFDNYEILGPGHQTALDIFKDFNSNPHGFIIAIGEYGNGKSHLLAALLKSQGSGFMITEADLVSKLRSSYDDGGRAALVERYRSAKCLILDELDPKIKGDDIQPFLYEILNYRHDKDLPTGLASNEDLDGVLRILGGKLEDRIAAKYKLAKFLWSSYRRAK